MTPLVVDPSAYLKPHHSVGHCQLISRRCWRTRDQARRDIAVWIDTWYNRK